MVYLFSKKPTYPLLQKMEIDKEFIKHCALFLHDRGYTATRATKKICDTYGQVIKVRACYKWFERFREGDRELRIRPGRGRPLTCDLTRLADELQENSSQSQRELAEKLNCSQKSVANGLKKLGKKYKKGKWVPHQLSQDNKDSRVNIASSLLARHSVEPFLHRIVTGDEKWILYCNVTRKGQWLSDDEEPTPTPKPGLHPRKIMLSIWWDFQGIIHFELLPPNTTVTSQVYCQQLNRLHAELIKKRHYLATKRGVILHHDNALPNTGRRTLAKVRELGWELLLHPAYSPDPTLSDYHLFGSFQNFLHGKFYENEEAIRIDLNNCLRSKPGSFFSDGIYRLPDRWQEVVDRNG